MATKYKRKIKRAPREPNEASASGENTLLRESAEQEKLHEELTGINRANFDLKLHADAAAWAAILEMRNYDV